MRVWVSFRLPIKGQNALAGKSDALQVLCVNTRDRRSKRARVIRIQVIEVVQTRVIRFAFYAFHSFSLEVETNAGFCTCQTCVIPTWPQMFKSWVALSTG